MKKEFPPPDARFVDKLKVEQVWPSQNGSETGDGGSKSPPALISRCAADIAPKRIDFLWPGRIARGKHTAIAGEPGDGKSQLSVYVAATVSRGGKWPCDESRAPVGNVIILNAEDGADDTVVPRLIAAGADLKRVHIVSAVLEEGGKGRRTFNLQADLASLERKITEIGDVVLVIIDPISSYMGKADSHKNAEVRGALEPLSEMAERLKVAILSITHFSKSGAGNNTKALHRFIGSIAFVGAPRAAFAVIEDVDNEGRILFLHAKNNMAGKPQGLAYRLVQTIVGEPGQGIVASYVVWDGTPVTMSANEALRATDGGGDRTAAAEAEEFLRETLSSGPKPATDIKAESNEAGLSWATIRRAKGRLGVTAERESEGRHGRGRWLWALPSAARCSSNLQDAHVSDVSALHQNEHLAEKAPHNPPPKPTPAADLWQDLGIPDYLRRERLGAPAISSGPDDDLGDIDP